MKRKVPKCFGIWWEAVSGSIGENCRKCVIQNDCLSQFSKETIPEARKELGEKASLTDLSKYLEVDERAILIAMSGDIKPVEVTYDRSWSWNEKTYVNRWERERKRSKVIASLTPGMKLEKKYKGVVYSATVKKGGYDYDGKTFPTLHSLTEHIVGVKKRDTSTGKRKVCNWSAIKFWRLNKKEK